MNVQTIALTRAVSASLNKCELTHLTRQPIKITLARKQHHQYERILSILGCQVVEMAEEPELPDAVFVEDTAVVLDEIAVIARPGAISRRVETSSVATALKKYRQLAYIEEPANLEGGDVLKMGKHIYIGESKRTNSEGVEQLREIISPYGYTVHSVPVTGCLHLKSAATQITDDYVLINSEWIDKSIFHEYQIIEVDAAEPYASNVLRIGDALVYPTAYPGTTARLKAMGFSIVPINVSELIKAEGAVTCCSILFNEELH